MSVTDNYREVGTFWVGYVLVHLVCHVLDGAVRVGAFAQIVDGGQVVDESGPCGDRTEELLFLGIMQAANGPCDVDPALVVLVPQLLGKHPGELPDGSEQLTRWRLLQRDGF